MFPSPLIRRHPFAAVLALALFLGLAFQGSRGLLEPDEGRYTNVALQMLHTGDYISLHRNAEALHFTKPPVTYWAIAGSVAMLGYNEWGARLPMALAFVLSVGLVYGLGRRFVPDKPWLPALIYACSPAPFLATNTVNTDSVLAALETLAMFCYVQARFREQPRWWIDAMWAAFGLAFLTKGPPALLPLLALVAFHFTHRKPGLSLFRPLGLLGFALIGFGWFAVVIHRHPGLLDYFLGHEVYARIATDKLRRFPQWYGPLIVYLPTLVLGTLPWLAIVVWKRWGQPFTRWKQLPEDQRFLWLWFLLPLLIFSLARSRLPLYVLPLFAPVSLLMAGALRDLRWSTLGKILIVAWVVLLIAVKGIVAQWPSDKDSRRFAELLRPMLPGKPREFLFVEDMNRNGLNLYFDADIERLSFKPMPHPISDSDYDSTVIEEFRERGDSHRVFIMKSDMETYFLNDAARAGVTPVKLGVLAHLSGDSDRERVVYTLKGDFP